MKLEKATTPELIAELERRGYRRAGRKRSCDCGECKVCRHRAKVYRYLAKRKAAINPNGSGHKD